jgi:signal peptidase I
MDQAAAERTGPDKSAEGQAVTVDETAGVPASAQSPEHIGRDGAERDYRDGAVPPHSYSGEGDAASHLGGPPYYGHDYGHDYAAEAGASADASIYANSDADADADLDADTPTQPPTPRAKKTGLALVLAPFAAVWHFAFPKKPRPFLVELPFLLAIALVLAFLIKTFLVQAFVIPSGSMQNTLAINDRVLVNRFANWMGDKPNRGDIVVFQDPGGWLEDQPAKPKNVVGKALTAIGLLPEDNGDLIKRVIGIPGDHVACKGPNSPVTVNGVALTEPYLYPDNQASLDPFDVVVPPGHLWVMGDHRAVSEDSRPHERAKPGGGMVPISNVVGHAVLIVWPPSHFGTLPLPKTFDQKALNNVGLPGAVAAASVTLSMPMLLVRSRRRKRDLAG